MRYELQLLKSAVKWKKAADKLNEQIRQLALKSFSAETKRDGTLGQVCEISVSRVERDLLLGAFSAVRRSLDEMPVQYRELIRSIYAKNNTCKQLAQQYNVPLCVVYRKHKLAVNSFGQGLCRLGYTRRWFDENFAELKAIANCAVS